MECTFSPCCSISTFCPFSLSLCILWLRELNRLQSELIRENWQCPAMHALPFLCVFSVLCDWKPKGDCSLGLIFRWGNFFAVSTEGTEPWLSVFPWINNSGLCRIKDNNRFLDPHHPSPTPASSLSVGKQAPVVKRQTGCADTVEHYTQRERRQWR